MDRDEFARSVRRRLGPKREEIALAIIADADELLAWGIEQYARPHYGRWLTPGGKPQRGSRLAPVTELPGTQ